jgi:valyl-tRNA synthetase
MGHALNNTLQDISGRFERMRGKDVLWQPGMDHAGIATRWWSSASLPSASSRRAATWAARPSSSGLAVEGRIRRHHFQPVEAPRRLLRLVARALHHGRRPVGGRARSLRRLYKQGLIYKDKRLVNWDPKLLTAISDLEVEQVEIKGNLWHLRYPLEAGVTYEQHLPIAFEEDLSRRRATISSSPRRGPRPCSATPALPSIRRTSATSHLIGKHVILPLVGRKIPIVGDDYADPRRAPAPSRSRRRTISTTSRSASAGA